MIFLSVLSLCKFSVLSLKMIIISNHNNFIYFYILCFLVYKLQIFLTHHVHFTLFICGKSLLEF
jgi:1-acyl-sn-glycerol-3-phosphate acyltransferase